MRILLVYPDLRIHVNYPLGLGILSSLLRKEGHEVGVLHFNEELDCPFDTSTLGKAVSDLEPQLIAFSSVSNQFQYVKAAASSIKRNRDIPILAGGVHATIAPEKVLGLGVIDMVCRGEGEEAFLDLVSRLERGETCTETPNMGFRTNGGIRINPLRPLIDGKTFDSLPFPDRESFDFRRIVEKKHGWANIMASRGCIMKCSYCVNHYYRGLYREMHDVKAMTRHRKVDTVIAETAEMVERYPNITLINFDDDIFTLDQEWLGEFCEKYPRMIGLPFACNSHPTTLDAKNAKMLAGAGCAEVKIGIESGSQRIRGEVLRRPFNEKVMVTAFAAAEEAGIRAWSFNMIGLPTETKEEMLMTARLNARIRPYITRCSIFFPYEGTDLHRSSLEHGMIDEGLVDGLSSHFEDSVLKMPQLSRDEIIKFKTLFKWHVDAESDIEAAPLFRALIAAFEKLPGEDWLSGKGQELFKQVDNALDSLLRELKLEHYATRRHLDLRFSKKLSYQLP